MPKAEIYLYVMASTSWTDVLGTRVALLILDSPGIEQMSHFVVYLLVASWTERRASSSCLITARHPYSHPVDRAFAKGGFGAPFLSTLSVLIPLITTVQYNVALVKEAYAIDQLGRSSEGLQTPSISSISLSTILPCGSERTMIL